MIRILRILFLCAVLTEIPAADPETVSIPVEIHGGGTVWISEEENTDPAGYTQKILLQDGEKGRAEFSFEGSGTWTYTLKQQALRQEFINDPKEYILKIHTVQDGRVESVLLFEKDSDEKKAEASWSNILKKSAPDTGDNTMIRLYALTSMISLVIAGVMFRCAKGGDDEA